MYSSHKAPSVSFEGVIGAQAAHLPLKAAERSRPLVQRLAVLNGLGEVNFHRDSETHGAGCL